ncbi:MAG: hypothetical protein JWL88_374 [Parcubacteria group bacterium]|nr:hypothetical protein [Parcubacteria group bacterium]
MDLTSLPGFKTVDTLYDATLGKGVFVDYQPILYTFAFLNLAFLFISPAQTLRNYEFLIFFAPLWLPYLVVTAAANRFIQFNRATNLSKQNYILLELRLPRDTMKTPLAMETFFSNMHFGPGETTEYKKYWLGNTRPSWSFEIVSLGGRVHFYIWMRAVQRRSIESYLYSQYPGMEIIEAEDYSLLFDPADFSKNSMFGEEFVKKIPDSSGNADPYPIKTYMDYGLDKTAKPEEQVDPLAQIIELLGSIGPKEQYWIQIIIRQTKKEKYKNEKDWKKAGLEEIDKIRNATVKAGKYTDPVTGKVIETQGFPNPTKGQLETINAIERNTNKPGFDVGIRTIYSAPKDAYQGIMANFILALWKPFANESGAELKHISSFSAAFNDYPWEDRKGLGHRFLERKIVDNYRRRVYFIQPYIGPWSIMSSEELATLFHVPSSTVQTPGLPRIQSSTAGAPPNLPT